MIVSTTLSGSGLRLSLSHFGSVIFESPTSQKVVGSWFTPGNSGSLKGSNLDLAKRRNDE